MEVTILGGGVIGLSIAWELANRGKTIKVLERNTLGSGASSAAAGILPAVANNQAIDPVDTLRARSHKLYPSWAAAISETSHIDLGLLRSGGIYLARTAGEIAALIATANQMQELGIEAKIINEDELKRVCPELKEWIESPGKKTALWAPDDWQVRPRSLCKGLAAACLKAGVTIEENVRGKLARHIDKVTFEWDSRLGVGSMTTHTETETIILCCGAWSGLAGKELGLELSVIPIRGQMLMYRLAQPLTIPIINEGHRYLVPRSDGTLLVGSCEEEAGFDNQTTPESIKVLSDWGGQIMPSLKAIAPYSSWAGLRPATVDGRPMLGRVPSTKNLYGAFGHFRSGLHLAPVTAELIADLVEGRTPPLDCSPFSPGRGLTSSQYETI
jgi:glycine oxidase